MDIFNVYLPIAGTEFNILLLIALGFCVGVLGGFFGVGGAWIITPALNIFGFPMPFAIGTDFAHIFGKSIIATKKHSKMGNVDWKLGVTTIFGTIAGVEIGAQLIMYLERTGKQSGFDLVGNTVRWTYIVFLFALAIIMFYDYFVVRPKKDKIINNFRMLDNNPKQKKSLVEFIRSIQIPPMISFPKSGIESISFWVIVIIFFFCGFISGFLGVGGGFIRMPTLVYLIGCPTALAVGTDLFIVLLDSAYGCFSYALKGRVEIFAAVFMLCGAAIGTQIGVTAVKYVRGYGIRLLFAFMVLFAGISVLLRQIHAMTSTDLMLISGIVIMGSAAALCLIIIYKLLIESRKLKLGTNK